MRPEIAEALEVRPSRTGDRIEAAYRFRPEQPVFRGHFPGHPLLPGIFQIELTLAAVEMVLGHACRLSEVRKAKFMRPVAPGELVRLEADLAEVEGGREIKATLLVDGTAAAKLVLLVAE
jgi:3-hydroxymyristoyl/3-hydroxydecanoyl-(acyl carrier protein) dehydratase